MINGKRLGCRLGRRGLLDDRDGLSTSVEDYRLSDQDVGAAADAVVVATGRGLIVRGKTETLTTVGSDHLASENFRTREQQ